MRNNDINPLFSVLIANYNNSKFLLDAINSIKKQTYDNWEIIIVDDFSDDNPSEVYNLLKDHPKIKIYYNAENKKTAYTFKRALENSCGSICGFLGPDDFLDNRAIEKTVIKHLEYPKASIVYTLNYLCDENMNIIKNAKGWGGIIPQGESQLTANPGDKITSFATFKRYYYDLTLGIDTIFTRGFDQDFYYKMEEVGEIVCIPEKLYFYRQHKNNISLNENNVKAWYWLYIANRNAYYRRKGSNSTLKNITLKQLHRNYLIVCLLKIDQKFRQGNLKNICFYYFNALLRVIVDEKKIFIRSNIFFVKRYILYVTRNKPMDNLHIKHPY